MEKEIENDLYPIALDFERFEKSIPKRCRWEARRICFRFRAFGRYEGSITTKLKRMLEVGKRYVLCFYKDG